MKPWILVIVLGLTVSSVRAQNIGHGIVINEVYIASGAGTGDQYIEFYNPQTTTQYLDANMIVQFGATGGALTGKALTGVLTAWKFPGKPGGKTLPLAAHAFAVVAANAKSNTGGLDLSKAAYEARASMGVGNPNAIQLHNLSPALTYPGITPAATADAIVLTDGTDSVITDGINLASVLDAMQYNTALTAGHFPIAVDSFPTGGPNLKYGYSMERNQAGVTTHNSYADFGLQYPSPGSEHASTPPPTPVTPKDLYPFDLGRYVDLNQYDTASTGGAVTQFLSSQTVMGAGLSFQGMSGVGWVRDSSLTSGSSSTISDLHFHATAAGDIQVYGDQQLLNYALESMASSFTPPNTWLDYFKMSSGVGTTYPVGTVTGTYSGANVSITFTGVYRGIERVTVPRGTYDSAYRFDLPANVQITFSGLPLGGFTSVHTLWLVRGIGIVRASNPHAGVTVAGNPINIDGGEKEMTAFGIRSLAVSDPTHATIFDARVYPNPASDVVNLSLNRPASRILLYRVSGQFVRSFDLGGSRQEAILMFHDLANGAYLAQIQYRDGTASMASFVVGH